MKQSCIQMPIVEIARCHCKHLRQESQLLNIKWISENESLSCPWNVCSIESDSLRSEDGFSVLGAFIDFRNGYKKGLCKFYCKIRKSATETYLWLIGNNFQAKYLSRSNVFICFNKWPMIILVLTYLYLQKPTQTAKIRKLVRSNRRLTIREMVGDVY